MQMYFRSAIDIYQISRIISVQCQARSKTIYKIPPRKDGGPKIS